MRRGQNGCVRYLSLLRYNVELVIVIVI